MSDPFAGIPFKLGESFSVPDGKITVHGLRYEEDYDMAAHQKREAIIRVVYKSEYGTHSRTDTTTLNAFYISVWGRRIIPGTITDEV